MSAIIPLYLCFTCTSAPHRCEPSWRGILAFNLSLIAGVKRRSACTCVAEVLLRDAAADKQLPFEERQESVQVVISSVLHHQLPVLSCKGVLMLTLPDIALVSKKT